MKVSVLGEEKVSYKKAMYMRTIEDEKVPPTGGAQWAQAL